MSNNKGSLILVTGGAGYVGSVLVRHLLDIGYSVRVLDFLMHGKESLVGLKDYEKFEFVEGDVRDPDIVRKCLKNVDCVIHLAAITGAPESNRIPEVTWDINLEGTKNLVNVSIEENIDRFIFFSTCSNYGASGSDVFATEESSLDPISAYAESKVAAEKYILAKDRDIKFNPTILRLATVFGVSPRMRFDLLVNDFVREAYFKKKLVVYGNQGRTFVYIGDVARAVEAVLSKSTDQLRYEVFNVGSTKHSNCTKHELGKIVVGLIPDSSLEYTKKDLDDRDYKVSFDKIHNTLGFNITRDTSDGVKEILEFLKSTPDLDFYNDRYSNLNKYLKL